MFGSTVEPWTRPSDIAWATGYLIAAILLVLLWANVPA